MVMRMEILTSLISSQVEKTVSSVMIISDKRYSQIEINPKKYYQEKRFEMKKIVFLFPCVLVDGQEKKPYSYKIVR